MARISKKSSGVHDIVVPRYDPSPLNTSLRVFLHPSGKN